MSPSTVHIFGISQTAIKDNGPDFRANEFKIFFKDQDIQHDTSGALYSHSNGLAKRTIQIVKRNPKKAMKSYQNP